jgi:predicted dinucleotide-binding enzyme
MHIAIIGSGNVGTALATSFVRAGHDVAIASPNDAAEAAAASGARVAPSNVDAVRDADIVVLAVYYPVIEAVAAEIAAATAGKIVVDVTNRMTFGEAGPEIDTSTSNAEEIAGLLPGARVVKAFNTVLAGRQVDPIADGVTLDAYVAADDPAARATVMELAASIGLDAVDAGPLVRARQLEGLAFLNIYLNVVNGGSWQSGWKLVGAPKLAPVAA